MTSEVPPETPTEAPAVKPSDTPAVKPSDTPAGAPATTPAGASVAPAPSPAPSPVPSSDAHERERRHAQRAEGWSIVWMLVALLVWGWFAFLMLADYGPEYDGRPVCRGPLVGPLSEGRRCEDAWRAWPALLGVLALATLTTVTAAATTVYAKVLTRLAHRDRPSVPLSEGPGAPSRG
ncbi:hypothetical protein ACFUIZ_04110 [Streptomyces cinereoruber]|uniref:hypothetical protein n=1 Tax=Streptomyces cinereoruber TaxID=67260 RepID=UPI003635C903